MRSTPATCRKISSRIAATSVRGRSNADDQSSAPDCASTSCTSRRNRSPSRSTPPFSRTCAWSFWPMERRFAWEPVSPEVELLATTVRSSSAARRLRIRSVTLCASSTPASSVAEVCNGSTASVLAARFARGAPDPRCGRLAAKVRHTGQRNQQHHSDCRYRYGGIRARAPRPTDGDGPRHHRLAVEATMRLSAVAVASTRRP